MTQFEASTGGFRPSDRLLDGRDFDRVLRRGKRRSTPELAVVTHPKRVVDRATARGRRAGSDGSRLGITAGRKAGNAVERNRFKRRVREWFRHHRGGLPGLLDVVVIARRPGIDLSLLELDERLARLLGLDRSQMAGNKRESDR